MPSTSAAQPMSFSFVRNGCFLCRDNHDDLDARYVRRMHEIFYEEMGRGDSTPMSIALILSNYYLYNVHIEDGSYPVLTPEIALAHIEGAHQTPLAERIAV